MSARTLYSCFFGLPKFYFSYTLATICIVRHPGGGKRLLATSKRDGGRGETERTQKKATHNVANIESKSSVRHKFIWNRNIAQCGDPRRGKKHTENRFLWSVSCQQHTMPKNYYCSQEFTIKIASRSNYQTSIWHHQLMSWKNSRNSWKNRLTQCWVQQKKSPHCLLTPPIAKAAASTCKMTLFWWEKCYKILHT